MAGDNELVSSNCKEDNIEKNVPNIEIKVYKKRWLILILLITFSVTNLIQGPQYAVIADVIKNYYQVSYSAIDWTVMISSLLIVIFNFPGVYMIERIGLRRAAILGTIGTAVGTWIKIASVHPDRFYLVLIGHGFVSLFKLCFMPIIPKIAATWFGYEQIAVACGVSFAGIQGGSALSSLLPTLLVVEGEKLEVQRSLYIINLTYAALATVMVPLAFVFFSDKPKLPPSTAQLNFINTKNAESMNFIMECKSLFRNKDYLCMMLINGANEGIVTAIMSLSNQIILSYYPKAAMDVGISGALHVCFSVLGSMASSVILDKYKKFREMTWITFGGLFLSYVLFATTVSFGLPFVYISFILMGLFFGTILTVNVEVIVELTYPQSQNVVMGFTGISGQLSILGFTSLYGYIHRNANNNWANATVIAIVFVVNLLFIFIKFNLRRTAGQNKTLN